MALSLVLLAQSIEASIANPIPTPLIEVKSPHNYRIYTTSTVPFSFVALPNPGFNFTSFSYIIDGQEAKTTDGNTTLTGLSPGSHTLKIYGNGTDTWSHEERTNILLYSIYFSVNYQTSSLVVFGISAAVLAPILLGLTLRHKQFIARLRRKKTAFFWLGLAGCLFSFLFFVPSTRTILDLYLFPKYYTPPMVSPVPGFITGIVLMVLGSIMMAFGTRKQK